MTITRRLKEKSEIYIIIDDTVNDPNIKTNVQVPEGMPKVLKVVITKITNNTLECESPLNPDLFIVLDLDKDKFFYSLIELIEFYKQREEIKEGIADTTQLLKNTFKSFDNMLKGATSDLEESLKKNLGPNQIKTLGDLFEHLGKKNE